MIVKYTRNFVLKYKYLYKKRSKNIKYDLEKYVSILKKTNKKNEWKPETLKPRNPEARYGTPRYDTKVAT